MKPYRYKMKILKIILLLVFTCGAAQAQYANADIPVYIDTYKDLAMKKMREYKIPASITLAQGILESGCGTSRLAKYGNNHFGIKCHGWKGDTLRVDDDALQECFRKYDQAEDSYNDHSLFLTSRSRYDNLFTLPILDYKAWAKGLKAAGYATNPKYPTILISLIERFDLAQYDTLAMDENYKIVLKRPDPKENVGPAPVEILPVKKKTPIQKDCTTFLVNDVTKYEEEDYPFTARYVYINNKTLFVVAEKGDTYQKIAKDVQLTVRNLLVYNDVPALTTLKEGQIVYIERKQKTSKVGTHLVEADNETIEYISQKYGIRLSSLCKYNGFNANIKLLKGEKVRLSY